ncbi:MAG: hypothetical protein GXP25_22355 [Planctomycetes bacterium]|nr:hypothetical protein [Planctomycetota bacterium]
MAKDVGLELHFDTIYGLHSMFVHPTLQALDCHTRETDDGWGVDFFPHSTEHFSLLLPEATYYGIWFMEALSQTLGLGLETRISALCERFGELYETPPPHELCGVSDAQS